MVDALPGSQVQSHEFTFFTNHTHVLITIARKPDVRMREIAATIGITERAVQRIVDDLTSSGILVVSKDGRRNRYEIQAHVALRHELSKHRKVGDLIRFIYPEFHAESRIALPQEGYAEGMREVLVS
jgi:DNA-binding MarR family transcriptional regulator